MTELVKARLGEIGSGSGPQQGRNWVDVQFNPTSLRVQISNRTAGGQQSGAQARQRPGTGEMQVSFDLVFDTADEGGDVLRRTAAVERFVRPRSAQPGQEAPPRVVFQWGSFEVQGVMESANLDLDFFDASGVPLRAKVAVTIKGQDPRWAYQPAQPGGAAAAGPQPGHGSGAGQASALNPPAGGAGGLPAGAAGTQGSASPVGQIVQAMPGESLPQLAARMGLAPADWRAMAAGAANPMSLSLGQEVALPAGLEQGAATGLGAQGRDPARTTSRMPLVDRAAAQGGASPAASAPDEQAVRQGQALAMQGGVSGAIGQAHSQAHQQGAGGSRAAFGMGAAPTSDTDSRPWGAGVPLRPRLGGAQRALPQLDPTQPGWVAGVVQPSSGPRHNDATALRAPSGTAGLPASAVAPRPRVSQASSASTAGCGCRGAKGRSTSGRRGR